MTPETPTATPTSKITPERRAELKRLKQIMRAKKKEGEDAEKEYKRFEEAFFEDMREEGLLTLNTTEGQYSAKSTIYAHIQDRDAFVEWCKKLDLVEELLRETEEKGRLNEMVRGLLDTGEDLPPGVGWYSRDYISITEAK